MCFLLFSKFLCTRTEIFFRLYMCGLDNLCYICALFVPVHSIIALMTIKDIAKKAGVSRGTVDRVLHNRGSVSESKRLKVQEIIDRMDFRPNVHASLIASAKPRKIVCLIPQFTVGDIWDLTAKGVGSAAQEVKNLGVSVELMTYNQYDADSFNATCDALLEHRPDGVVVAPIFRSGTFNLVKRLSALDVPYVYIDTKLDDDGYLEFFGLPMYQSGYLGGRLLTENYEDLISEIINVKIIRDKNSLSDPTMVRSSGFMDYIHENLPQTNVKTVWINPLDKNETFAALDSVLDGESVSSRTTGRKTAGKFLITFNSRVHLVADYIRERKISGCRVVGYDMLEKNLQALRDGTVSCLIAQHSDTRAALAVRSLAEYLVLGHPILRRDNYSMMDILNSCNCDYY